MKKAYFPASMIIYTIRQIQSNSDTQNEKPIIYTAIEKEAVFKGGDSKLNQYISQHLNIPESAHNFSGKVIVNFVVNEDGSVSNIEIKQTIPIELKNEIEKLFKNMPNWTPAKSEGKNVKMRKIFPVLFSGNE
ncbi:energy transducer TonB [Moheibacter sediminis]|nr:energy transducer TonB [Moheibacter sediminis]